MHLHYLTNCITVLVNVLLDNVRKVVADLDKDAWMFDDKGPWVGNNVPYL